MTRNEILEHRSEKDEYTFGIQKFDNAKDAFDVMDNEWGEMWGHKGFTEIRIGNNAFLDQVYYRVVELFERWLEGEYSEEKFLACLGFNDEYTTDELLNFNFFLYNEENDCYYTSMMEFGDDYNSVLSDRQWKIFYEIYYNYHLNDYVIGIVKLLLDAVLKDMKEWGDGNDNENEIKAWWCTDSLADLFYDEVYAEHINLDKKNKLFCQHGTLKLPKIIQGKYRIYIDPNLTNGVDWVLDVNSDTKEEAIEYFIKVYEEYREKHLDEWEKFYKNEIYLRDNSTGEKIYYEQVKG